mgnify:CR=1 FL=1
MSTKNHPIFHLILKDDVTYKYEGNIGGHPLVFCKEVLYSFNIPNGKIPYALFFHYGSSFILEKRIHEDWVEENHRLNGNLYSQKVKVLKERTTYWFNGVDITNRSRPVDFDRLFIYLGNKISFDCYYYE